MAFGPKSAARMLGLRRTRVAAGRLLLERAALRIAHPRRPRIAGRILCYHSVGQPEFGVNDVTAAQFRRQIEFALASGRRFVPASDIARGERAPDDLAVTFDDGARSVLTRAAPILQEYRIPFTVFVVAQWADEARAGASTLGWRDLETLVEMGCEIGSHSLTHPDFGRIDEGRAAAELFNSRKLIAARLGVRCDSFAIPYGVIATWSAQAARLASDAGYARVYAQSEDRRPPATIGRSFVTCFDGAGNFKALLTGAYDRWQEWS